MRKTLTVPSLALSLVVPVFNEAENIRPLLEELRSVLDPWPGGLEFVFVDDGSRDATLDELRREQQSDPRVRVAHFRKNLGQTAAMAAGFRLARGETIVTLDGDLQNDPRDISRLVEMLRDGDCVCGVRRERRDSPWKRLSSRIGNGFRNWATGDNIEDTGCTLKAYRRACLEKIDLYRGLHRFLPTLFKMHGFRVVQVPVHHRPRLRGKTKYGTWGRMMKGLSDVYAVRWMMKNRLEFEPVMEVLEPPAARESAAAVPACRDTDG
jgi:glycosyltransferase involved in cell wall biosynthesis